MKPDEVSNENQSEIWKRIYWPKIKLARKPNSAKPKQKKNKYQAGETVQITTERGKFDPGYNTRFSIENFKIADRRIRQGFDAYSLKYMNNELILSMFYPQEVQRVQENPDEEYAIEKIIKSRRSNYLFDGQAIIPSGIRG